MTTEDDREKGERAAAGPLRVIAGIILFPLLWIGVAVNFLGLAERFSFLPGVSRDGGIVSAVVALVFTVAIIGVVAGGAAVAMGTGIPIIGGGDDGGTEMTPTPTGTPMPTPTLTGTPTPRATPSSTAMPDPTPDTTDLETFKADFRDRIELSMENDSLTDIPTLAIEYRQGGDGETDLWLVYRECDYHEQTVYQYESVSIAYANAVGNFNGDKPDELHFYAVSRIEERHDFITSLRTSTAQQWFDSDIGWAKFEEAFADPRRAPTDSEEMLSYRMTVNESGDATADKVFEQHYPRDDRSEERCPAP